MADNKPIGNIKLGISLEGIDESIKNLDQLNKHIKVNESSMKANLKAFDSSKNSVEALSQKQKDLTSVTSDYDAKIKLLKKRLEEQEKAENRNETAIANTQKAINDATAKYNGYNSQLQKTKEQLAYAESGVESLSDALKENEKQTNQQVKALKDAGDEAGAFEAKQKGLEKQQDLLNESIKAQKEAVSKLSSEFGASSTQVKKAEQSLQSLENQSDITDKQLDALRASTKKAADTFDNSSDSVGIFQGALMADFATEGLEKVKDMVGNIIDNINEASDQYNTLKAQLGSGVDVSEVQTNVANVYAKGYGEDVEEVQQALTAVKQLMPYLSGKELEDMTARALTFSKATDTDINESIKGARTLMNEFKITSVDAFDLMNKGAQNGLNFSGDLADQISEFAPIFNQAGYSANDMFGMMNNALDGGAYNLDRVNDLMNEFTTRLDDGTISDNMGLLSDDTQRLFEEYKKGGATASEMFNAVVGDINNMENQTDKAAAASVMFGSLGEDSSLKMVLGLTKVNDKYKDVQGTSDDVNSAISNSSPWEALKRNLKSGLTPFAEGMSGIKSQVTDVINNLFEKFPTATKLGLGVLLGTLALLGTAFTIALIPAGIFSGILAALGTAVGVLTSPITLAIAGIGLLVGAFILAYKNIEPFRNMIDGILDSVKNFATKVYNEYLKPAIDEVMGAFRDFTTAIKEWWDENGAQFIEAISNVLGFIWDLISPFLDKTLNLFKLIFKGIAETVKFAWDIIKNQTQAFFTIVKGLLDVFIGVFTGDWKKVWDGVKSIFTGAIDFLTSIFRTNLIGKITSFVVGFVQDIPKRFSSMWDSIKQFFSDGITTLVDRMKEVPGKIAEGISKNAGKVVDAFKSMFKKAQQVIKKPVNMVIGGANWVLKKFGAKELPTWQPDESYAKGTPRGGHKGGNALVNDGNGAEMVIMPNGQSFIPRGRNVLIPNAPKGMHVMNARDTALAMGRAKPTFAYKNGTSWWDNTKNFIGNMGKWAKEKVSNVWDFVSNPSKLVDIALSKFVNFGDATDLALDAGKGLVGKAKDSMLGWVKDLFSSNDQGGVFNGSTDKAWGVYKYLRDIADSAIAQFGSGLRITSGYRAGDPYYHGRRQAIDIALPSSMNGSAKNKNIADWVFNKFRSQVAYVITNGRVKDRSGFSGTGKDSVWKSWAPNDHYDHVHINGLLGASDVVKATGKTYSNSVEKWRSIASQALQMEGQYSTANLNALMNQMRTESNGNPYAINNWDINAKNGTPSKGLMQVIDPTFRAYARKGYNTNIYDPLSNILASIRYARSRYGSLTNAYRGVGYANGGFITRQHLAMVGEGNKPEVVIPLDKAKRSRAMQLLSKTKRIMGDNDGVIIQNNTQNNDQSEIIALLTEQNSLLLSILSKHSNVYLDSKKVNRQLEITRKETNMIHNKRLGFNN
ncbi:phage tail tape measure protein [Enterococcus casseliflavus]|uniref:phage tail tape measure protein n=1 Tax=Enterococcus casseliflavus TaxID=37734 RepID=UPI002DBE30A1|nr:phage tail tape measure protein [Enterococcus casseliflavus]MEB6213006.1 phage tail tape measure protein [Enterococcus casseliflavus]